MTRQNAITLCAAHHCHHCTFLHHYATWKVSRYLFKGFPCALSKPTSWEEQPLICESAIKAPGKRLRSSKEWRQDSPVFFKEVWYVCNQVYALACTYGSSMVGTAFLSKLWRRSGRAEPFIRFSWGYSRLILWGYVKGPWENCHSVFQPVFSDLSGSTFCMQMQKRFGATLAKVGAKNCVSAHNPTQSSALCICLPEKNNVPSQEGLLLRVCLCSTRWWNSL